MGKIVVLPDTLCNQIAAGEVVERPAAVVKELIENSIDAGGRKISVFLLQGGRREIRVVDNGSGMSRDDALLALERHATSKIRSIDDLQAVRSLGFRGEALPSIAAVSRFELVTKEADALSGVHVHMDSGVLRDVREVGCPSGTMVIVRDLFHNLPVRRKFLRSVDTELSHISDLLQRTAMAHPDIHLQLSHQDRLQYDYTKAKSLATRVGQVLGADLAGKLVEFSVDLPSLRLHGLASPPELQRSNAQSIFAYVNGRPVRDRLLSHAILSAYDSLLPKGKFPLTVLFVEIDPHLVDVNVHPTKREVRFREPGEIIQSVRDVIRLSLERPVGRAPRLAAARLGQPSDPPFARKREYARELQSSLGEAPIKSAEPNPPAQMRVFPETFRGIPKPAAQESLASEPRVDPLPDETLPSGRPSFSSLPIVGQIADAYVLLEAPDGLIILDQHAAHERVIYDRLASTSRGREPSQRLMQSIVLDFLPREAAMLRRWIDRLSELGFEMEPFGGESFVIYAVPAALGEHPPHLLIGELLKVSCEDEEAPRLDLLAGLAKTAACHSAIRSGRKLKIEEIRSLLVSLDNTPNPSTCPHGRPLWHKLTREEIARFFQRS